MTLEIIEFETYGTIQKTVVITNDDGTTVSMSEDYYDQQQAALSTPNV